MEKILVIANPELENEEIFYCGDVEIEAFKRFSEISYKFKRIVKAEVKMIKLFGVDLISNYKVIERIK